jgi:hypothetical protein
MNSRLVAEFTEEEIKKALDSIGDLKGLLQKKLGCGR